MTNPAPAAPGVRLKASTLRSYVAVLVKDHRRDAVLARVPPETAALMVDLPLATSWIDFKHIMHITQAVEALTGLPGVRDFHRKAVDDAKGPHIRILEGVLRMFGMSPAVVFKRLNDIVKHTIENNVYSYRATSDRSGVMEVSWLLDYEVPSCMFHGMSATLQTILDTCGVKGVVGIPERSGPAAARYVIQW
jgi:hypothetical protein